MLERPARRTRTGADCRAAARPSSGSSPRRTARLDIGMALSRLAYDPKNPSAIAGAVLAARAGARGVREVISSEMWECLNVTGHGLTGQRRVRGPAGPARVPPVRPGARGAVLRPGRLDHEPRRRLAVPGARPVSLERVDMTARLLLARMPGRRHAAQLAHCCCAPAARTSRSSGPTAGPASRPGGRVPAAGPAVPAVGAALAGRPPRTAWPALNPRRGADAAWTTRPGARSASCGPGWSTPTPSSSTDQLPELLGTLQAGLRAGVRGDHRALLPVRGAGRLGTGGLMMGWRLRDRAHHPGQLRRRRSGPPTTRPG